MRVSNALFEHIYVLWSWAFVAPKHLNCSLLFFCFVGFWFGFFFLLLKGCKGVSQRIGIMALTNGNSLCE